MYPSSSGGIKNEIKKKKKWTICLLLRPSDTNVFTDTFLSVFLPTACVSGPPGSTPVLRQDEEVQTTWPGVPERSAQTGALSVQQGKWAWGEPQQPTGHKKIIIIKSLIFDFELSLRVNNLQRIKVPTAVCLFVCFVHTYSPTFEPWSNHQGFVVTQWIDNA